MGEPKSPVYSLKSYPYFVGGIVVFFLSNGYSRYIDRISFLPMVLFAALWLSISFFVLYLINRRFHSICRAGIFTGYLLVCYLFFGDIHEGFSGLPVLNRFRTVCILLVCFGVILYIYFRKTRKSFATLSTYLNLLIGILIIIDIVNIIGFPNRSLNKAEIVEPGFPPMVVNKRPDIYLIIMDEYAGNETLKRHFSFDNEAFLSALRDRSFFVASNSISNYTSTPVSVASIFGLGYVSWAKNEKEVKVEDFSDAEQSITKSPLLHFLGKNGYHFHNFSIFNIGDDAAKYHPELMATQLRLLTTKTFGRQLKKHVLISLETYPGTNFNWIAQYFQETYQEGNSKLVDLTLATARSKSNDPKFVYLHLLMPHWPYLNDSSGPKPGYNAYRSENDDVDKGQYLAYLKYTNKYIIGVIDSIRKSTGNEAIIVLMSDHGYRKLNSRFVGSGNSNLNATYLPGKNYEQFYDSVSNVNQFRVILNSTFGTQLPLKTDSIVF